VDLAATLHRRRKNAMISLLSEFETEIQPLIAGNEQAIEHFKRSCREKLNAVTFEAIELMQLGPGEELNELAVDLTARLQSGDNGGTK
jgi:hypothetical protein